ncbi:DUF2855 domain-containing protein [Histoplasma capsulatum var. duboisii H88]|uniref:DUF2855 domain-containing protein n=1 Tax=Ajellomyces capsulatus (strain H88) TaxID=544711 RepID=A0A8A1LK28_AJEC8|nr:DUF2855 domain-containing protein [Histoplasma capsulatum var. duboisii H88]
MKLLLSLVIFAGITTTSVMAYPQPAPRELDDRKCALRGTDCRLVDCCDKTKDICLVSRTSRDWYCYDRTTA